MAKDPVCDREVDEQAAGQLGLVSECEGRRFYFCCRDCKAQFERFPAIFGGIEPAMLEIIRWAPGAQGG